MNLTLSPRLRALLGEIRDNPRLQLGTGLIGALVLGWFVLVLADWRGEKMEALQQARQRLAQVQELAGQQAWIERADAARRLSATLEAEIPTAASAGLAQAEFQGWLRDIVNAQGVPLRLDVQAPVRIERPADIVKVTATVSGGLPPGRVMEMIHRIEGRAALSTIPTLTIRSDGLNQTFSLTIQGFYRLPPQGPGA